MNMTTSEGIIKQCKVGQDVIERVEGENLKKDYFGFFDPSSSGSMGYNWRQVIWSPVDKKFYGIHGNSGYLFSFDRLYHVLRNSNGLHRKIHNGVV